MMSRQNELSRRKKWAYDGSCQFHIRLEANPGTNNRSDGPSPTTWYAMLTPSGVLA